MLDSRRQDIAAGTLKAGDDRNAEWIGALEGARWPKPDARSVCRAARRFAHGTAHLPAETRAERGACGWRWMGLRYANAEGEP